MTKLLRIITAVVLLLGSLASIWFLVNNLQPLKPALYSFTVLGIIGIVLAFRLFASQSLARAKTTCQNFSQHRHFTAIALAAIIVLGVCARLFFYARFTYAPISDPVTFYSAAHKLAIGQGMHGDSYVAFFPYLAAYDNILALAMKLIPSPWLATILLNTALDLAAAAIAYFLIKKLARSGSKLPILAFGVWLLNPFNILFSVISLPIIAVNFFIITSLFLIYLLSENVTALKSAPTLGLAILVGLTMGYGNCFRPVFSIGLVALIMLFAYLLLTRGPTKKLVLLLGGSFLLIAVLFSGIQKLNLLSVAHETNLKPAAHYSGWSIYVGSNWYSDGTWTMADQFNMQAICQKSTNESCQNKLQKAGIARYESYGKGGTLSLFIRKLSVFSSNQNSMYNADQSIPNYTKSTTAKVLNIYFVLFMVLLFALSAGFLYRSAESVLLNQKVAPVLLFAVILLVGFFLSDALVEAAPRYAQILYPIFTICAVLSLDQVKLRSRRAR